MVPKTKPEAKLTAYYLEIIKDLRQVPQNIVDKFKKDSDKIRYENKIYTNDCPIWREWNYATIKRTICKQPQPNAVSLCFGRWKSRDY